MINKAVDFYEPNPPKDIQVEPDKKDDWENAGAEESRPVDVIPVRAGDNKRYLDHFHLKRMTRLTPKPLKSYTPVFLLSRHFISMYLTPDVGFLLAT